METEQVIQLMEECNHWQPDYRFACVDREKFIDKLNSQCKPKGNNNE